MSVKDSVEDGGKTAERYTEHCNVYPRSECGIGEEERDGEEEHCRCWTAAATAEAEAEVRGNQVRGEEGEGAEYGSQVGVDESMLMLVLVLSTAAIHHHHHHPFAVS